MQEQLFDMLFNKDDVTWQTMLYELVRTEQMDPWDIDIALLAQRFFDTVQKMREMDFRVSGKILLAAAIMLKIKSNQLLTKDLDAFDSLFSPDEEEEMLLDEGYIKDKVNYEHYKNLNLIPKTPQQRKRKISIYDLVDSLQKAIEVKRRRVLRDVPVSEITLPEKKTDISVIIKDIYGRIKSFFASNKGDKLTFSALSPSENRQDKVFTFIPLLHLSNQRKIDMYQYKHFGEIEIAMIQASARKQIEQELSSVNA